MQVICIIINVLNNAFSIAGQIFFITFANVLKEIIILRIIG